MINSEATNNILYIHVQDTVYMSIPEVIRKALQNVVFLFRLTLVEPVKRVWANTLARAPGMLNNLMQSQTARLFA